MNQLVRFNPPATDLPMRGQRRRGARSGNFGVLDIGTTKIVCVIGRIEGDGTPRALGFGWQKALGVKAGSIIDLEAAERAIRAAVAQAEEMADVQLRGVIVNLSCGQPASRSQNVQWPIGGRAATEADLRAMLQEGRRATPGVPDPRGMVCDTLFAQLHVVDAAENALSNLALCLSRCDLDVEEVVSAPFAAGLACLDADEAELGTVIIEMGGGTTSLAVFADGNLAHTAQLPIGGWQVTNDLARVLSTPIAHAERLKTMHGSALEGDDRGEMLPVPQVGEAEEHLARVPRRMITSIIRPRVEETFEILRDRLENAALPRDMTRRIVLTGGASQLIGVTELASRVLDRPIGQIRIARPRQLRGRRRGQGSPLPAAPIGCCGRCAGRNRRAGPAPG
ncbi:MAG: cell division protein FtsA [Rhodospirillales bacterium]|nr:cell division protein FtsA [Rhodospirillales bacterium]